MQKWVSVAIFGALFGAGGCGGAATPSPSNGGATPERRCPSAAALASVPWESSQVGDDPVCLEADQRIRRGAALGADVALVLGCLTGSAKDVADGLSNEVQEFVGNEDGTGRKGGGVLFEVNEESIANLPECLPSEFLDIVRGEIAASEDAKATIYLSPAFGLRDTRFSPGDVWGLPLSWIWGRGHREITDEVLKTIKRPGTTNRAFSEPAIGLLADASQDVDLFCWTHMPPHAQSALVDGMPEKTLEAQKQWAEFVMTYVQRAAQACQKPGQDNVRAALYHLGFALHSVQDLAAHQGRTNEEHAYDAIEKDGLGDPDKTKGAFELGKDITGRFVNMALAGPLSHCAEAFANFSGRQPLPHEKNKLLGSAKRDWTLKTFFAYRKSRKQFVPIKDKPGSRVRWLGADTLPKACDAAPCSTLVDLIFSTKPESSGKKDHCVR